MRTHTTGPPFAPGPQINAGRGRGNGPSGAPESDRQGSDAGKVSAGGAAEPVATLPGLRRGRPDGTRRGVGAARARLDRERSRVGLPGRDRRYRVELSPGGAVALRGPGHREDARPHRRPRGRRHLGDLPDRLGTRARDGLRVRRVRRHGAVRRRGRGGRHWAGRSSAARSARRSCGLEWRRCSCARRRP